MCIRSSVLKQGRAARVPSGTVPPHVMGRKFFYAKECPYPDECNPSNFKSWEPWGWTEESCRAQVLRHLKQSGKHKEHVPKGESRDSEYEANVELLDLEEDVYEEPGPPKKRRVDAEPPPSGRGPMQQLPALTGDGGSSGSAAGSAFRALDDGINRGAGAPITRQDLREVTDALGRCITGARHAQRLSAMAATAFNDEAAIFEEVKAFVDAKMALLR